MPNRYLDHWEITHIDSIGQPRVRIWIGPPSPRRARWSRVGHQWGWWPEPRRLPLLAACCGCGRPRSSGRVRRRRCAALVRVAPWRGAACAATPMRSHRNPNPRAWWRTTSMSVEVQPDPSCLGRGWPSRQHLFQRDALRRKRLRVLAVSVVVVPPLVRRGLRVALGRVLPLLLASERGDVEIAPGGA